MAWITPVTNRAPSSRTTASDMNRIVNNIAELGGSPITQVYDGTEIVTAAEWDYICEFARAYNEAVTMETTYINLNAIEQTLAIVHEHSMKLFPANTLYPGNSLYPDTEV